MLIDNDFLRDFLNMPKAKKPKKSDLSELLDATQRYFIVWANKDKKPGWCQRTEEAKAEIVKILKKHKRSIN